MSLLLNEEQSLLKDSAKAFVDENANLASIRAKRKEPKKAEIDLEKWKKVVELGWTAIPFSEEYGGLGLGYAELGVVLEELGRGLVDVPLFSNIVLAGASLISRAMKSKKSAICPN